jgi:hypothetical protein
VIRGLVCDRYPLPRAETTRDIIERVLAMTHEIAPQSVREKKKPTVEDILPLVLEEGCGFRPSRKGGIRLEGEVRTAKGGKKVAVVHNYGYVTVFELFSTSDGGGDSGETH